MVSVVDFSTNSEPLLRYCHTPKMIAAAKATPSRLVRIDVVEDELFSMAILSLNERMQELT